MQVGSPRAAVALGAVLLLGAGCRCAAGVDPDRSSVVLDVSTLRADGVTPATITVTVRDADGLPMPGQTVALAVSGEGNQVTQPVAGTDEAGVVQGSVASAAAGVKRVQASVQGVALTQQPLVEFTPVAVGLAFTVPPSSAAVQSPLTPPIEVSVVDAAGAVITSATGEISLAIARGPAGAVLGGPVKRLAFSGVARFDGLSLDRVGQDYALVASTPGLPSATSPGFEVTAGPPPQLVFLTQPDTLVAGEAFVPPLRVALQDGRGNLVSGAAARVALGIGFHAGPAVLLGTGSMLPVGAVATFPVLSLDRTGTAYTLVATAPGFAGATSSAFDVTPAAPARLVFLPGGPSQGTAGAALAPAFKVQVQDAFGNVAPGFAGQVFVELGANPGGATLSGPAAVSAPGSVATFAGLSLDRVGSGYTLRASAEGLASATSPAFSIGAASASGASSSAAVSPSGPLVADGTAAFQITVTVVDSLGNPVSGANVDLRPSAATGNVLVQPPATGADGVATGTLASTLAGTQEITVRVGTLDLATRPVVTFVAGPVSDAASTVTVSPASGIAADGTAAGSVTVTVKDAHGNPIAGSVVTIAASGTGNVIVQPSSPTDPSGVAVGSVASTRAEAKTIFATVGASLSLTQQPAVTFVAGAASAGASTVVASPAAGLAADGAAAAAITVTVLDAFGNPLAGQWVTLTASGSGNAVTQPAAATDANGVAVGSLSSTVAEQKTVSATVGGALLLDARPTVQFGP